MHCYKNGKEAAIGDPVVFKTKHALKCGVLSTFYDYAEEAPINAAVAVPEIGGCVHYGVKIEECYHGVDAFAAIDRSD